jgi:hypothetical protein
VAEEIRAEDVDDGVEVSLAQHREDQHLLRVGAELLGQRLRRALAASQRGNG